MRIQQELALDSFTVVYGYGKTIEEGGAAGKWHWPTRLHLYWRVCFCFHPAGVNGPRLLRPKGRVAILSCTVKERPQQQQQEKIEGAQGKLLTRVAQELKVAENPKLLDLRDHTALFVPFFPVILTLFCYFFFFFLSGKAAQQPQHAVYFGVGFFFCCFLSLFFIFFIGAFRSTEAWTTLASFYMCESYRWIRLFLAAPGPLLYGTSWTLSLKK